MRIERLGENPCVAMTTMCTTPGGITFYIQIPLIAVAAKDLLLFVVRTWGTSVNLLFFQMLKAMIEKSWSVSKICLSFFFPLGSNEGGRGEVHVLFNTPHLPAF